MWLTCPVSWSFPRPAKNQRANPLGDGWLRSVLASLPGNVAILDGDGRILAVNANWTQFSLYNGGAPSETSVGANYVETCGRAAAAGDTAAREVRDGVQAVLDGTAPSFSLECPCPLGGQELWFELVIQPLREGRRGAIVSYVDVTNRRAAEIETRRALQELAHTARVTMLGELSASIVHELSQPLTAVLTNAQAACRMVDRSPCNIGEVRAALKDIVANNQRAAGVIQRLRALLRNGEVDFQPVDLNALIVDVAELIKANSLLHGVKVKLSLAPTLYAVSADRVQMEQVLMNLAVNAAEAMESTPPGSRHLSIHTTNADEANVLVRVTDTGPGLGSIDAERIFDAFVTSKPTGLGIGLRVSRSIVIAHGGRIWAERSADRGATFCFMLPAERVAPLPAELFRPGATRA